jgi:CBS domain-containing protein
MMPVRDYVSSKVFMIHHDKRLIAVQELMQWAHNLHLGTVALDQVMKEPLQTFGSDPLVREAAKRLREGRIGCLPVIEAGHVVGIISEYDRLGIVEAL